MSCSSAYYTDMNRAVASGSHTGRKTLGHNGENSPFINHRKSDKHDAWNAKENMRKKYKCKLKHNCAKTLLLSLNLICGTCWSMYFVPLVLVLKAWVEHAFSILWNGRIAYYFLL